MTDKDLIHPLRIIAFTSKASCIRITIENMDYSNHNKEDEFAGTSSCKQAEDVYQVILYNDERNEAFFVVRCLMQIFNHDTHLAIKIMMEAHTTGKAIAEVEGSQKAKNHCEQLQSFGLTAEMLRI